METEKGISFRVNLRTACWAPQTFQNAERLNSQWEAAFDLLMPSEWGGGLLNVMNRFKSGAAFIITSKTISWTNIFGGVDV